LMLRLAIFLINDKIPERIQNSRNRSPVSRILQANSEMLTGKGLIMGKRKGFTLVELLVVIAIIALLMSILMPAMARVKKQAKAVMCQTQLRQWYLIFMMYTEDNEGFFHGELGAGGRSQGWVPALRPYYAGERKPKEDDTGAESGAERDIRLCPMANRWFRSQGYTGSLAAWGIYKGDTSDEGAWWAYEGDCGSYGLNGWVCNEEPSVDDWWDQVGNLWRTPNVKNSGDVPLFMDCQWVDGWPQERNDPPDYEGDMAKSGEYYFEQAMQQFCINRHGGGTVNCLFLDGSVRKVGLKELWTLKWHRLWVVDGPMTKAGGMTRDQWPIWMRNFQDY
jgi:prepilin-type N-terminal cleavage/methylation domain-containing protein/prepilin-type processing-associated H-X9-DG protein